MTRYFLTSVRIEGFRGVNNDGQPLVIHLDSDCVNSIYAFNGGGKSSIFEAIEYAITGRVGKLAALPATDKPDTYITNRFHSGRTATVELTFKPDDGAPPVEIKVQRDISGRRLVTSPTHHATPDLFLQSLNHDLLLLDYVKFERFIYDTPLNRGRSFAKSPRMILDHKFA